MLLEILFELIFEIPATRAIALAVLPALVLLLFVRKKDQLEPEPPKLVWTLVGLGCASVLIAMLLETAGIAVLNAVFNKENLLFHLLHWFIVVGIGEEFSKYIVMRLKTWKSGDFNCLYDGMVYAAAVSAGFALTENVIYMIRYGAGVLLMRGIVSIPAHISFSVFMGVWYGLARRYAHAGMEQKARQSHCLAVLVPAAAHGWFDLLASNLQETLPLILFIIFVIAMFIVAWRLIMRTAEQDHYLTTSTDRI